VSGTPPTPPMSAHDAVGLSSEIDRLRARIATLDRERELARARAAAPDAAIAALRRQVAELRAAAGRHGRPPSARFPAPCPRSPPAT
jgi:hypothetical protein